LRAPLTTSGSKYYERIFVEMQRLHALILIAPFLKFTAINLTVHAMNFPVPKKLIFLEPFGVKLPHHRWGLL
jgi:hypothetical protein